MAEKGRDVSLRKRKLHLDADDTVLGHRPRELNIVDYTNCRLREIVTLTKVVRNCSVNKNALQDLPRHMRRRAASHNIKRLPRRVRQRAEKSGLTSAPTKRPSRKHRRRPKNLQADYARRQRKHSWLETHLWHAKRFHLTERWGYKIPLHPNEKSIRAAYRASTHFCLIQDQSYRCCVELRGPQTTILEALNQLTHSDTGLTFSSASTLTGCREGHTFLYSAGQYPHHAIGPAHFLWAAGRGEDEACLWLWLHPSIHTSVVRELGAVLKITALTQWGQEVKVKSTDTSGEDKADTRKRMKTEKVENSQNKNSSAENSTKQSSSQKSDEVSANGTDPEEPKSFSNGAVTLTLLKDMLCRFHLSGPLSTAVLTSALTTVEGPVEGSSWQADYNRSSSEACQTQAQIWRDMASMGSPGELSPRVILGLTVKDPRLTLPQKKASKPSTDGFENSTLPSPDWLRIWPSQAAQSVLWDPHIRQVVKTTKLSDHEMNKKRQEQLVPGQPLDLGPATSYIPILLIQQPGSPDRGQPASHPSCPTHHGAGWDIVLPAGWGTAFWVALIYHGARAGGLRDDAAVAAEAGHLHFPEDYPDTSAGQRREEDEAKARQEKYERMPPAKRPNYDKLSVAAPFRAPWEKLLEEWSLQSNSAASSSSNSSAVPMECENSVDETAQSEELKAVVLRNKQKLRQLDKLCLGKAMIDTLPVLTSATLVPVHLRMIQRGTPSQSALICLPTKEDLETLAKDPKAAGPIEPLRAVSETAPSCKLGAGSETTRTSSSQLSNTSKTPGISLRKSCARELIGVVQHGGYSLSQGQGAAKGMVAYGAMHTILQLRPQQPAIVLLRPAHSLQYRYAYLSVNIQS